GGGREGVVHHGERVSPTGQSDRARDVDQLEERVRGGFQVDEVGGFGERGPDPRKVRHVDVLDPEAELPTMMLEQPPGAAVDVVHGNDPTAARERLEERRERPETGGEGETGGAALE